MKLNKNQGTNIVFDMLEQVGAVELLEEIIQGMSSDKLNETVKHLDTHLFDNHYNEKLNKNPNLFNN
jgi:hypothetical protein